MDLSTIKMHIDNFVDTWEGWGKVFTGLMAWDGSSNALTGFKSIFEYAGIMTDVLSSN